MELKFLGRGAAFNPLEWNTCAYVREGSKLLLLDCGETVFGELIRRRTLDGIREVWIAVSHMHSDHCGSLGSLTLYCAEILNFNARILLPQGDERYESEMRQLLNNKRDLTMLSDNTTKNIYVDDKGSVWIGTYKNGINQYIEGTASLKCLELGDINTVCEDHHGNYWIGTNDQGIIVYNPKTHEQTAHYTIQNSNLSSSIMVGSMCASDGTIWFGSYNG